MRTVLLVLLGIAAAGTAAFGVDRAVAYGRKLWAEHHPAAPTTTDVPLSRVTTSTTTTLPGPPRCTGTDLAGYLFNWQTVGGTLYEDVQVRSSAPSPCTLAGYPTLGAEDADGLALPAPNHQVSSLGSTTGFAASTPAPVVVPAGGTAWFELSFSNVCGQVLETATAPPDVANACYAGARLLVTPPSSPTPVVVDQPLPFTYATTGLSVGPFLAGAPPSAPPVTG